MTSAAVLGIVQIVAAALKALEPFAPAVVAVFTGGRPVAEVVADAEKAARALPIHVDAERRDIEARKQRG